MTAYYNENDPYAAQWLRNLVAAGHIAPGDVDERSIEDVLPDDIAGYTQAHFFAGIGVWSHALRLAGWEDTRPVWTGSCPCQPFSAAGKGAGFADERHLWPALLHLIEKRRPPVVFGEQVAGKNGLAWLDLVQADMEGLDYACGAVVAPAAGFGAPHIRERLYWAAYADDTGLQGRCGGELSECAEQCAAWQGNPQDRPSDAESERRDGREDAQEQNGRGRLTPSTRAATNGFWANAKWLPGIDGLWRPTEPGLQPVAYGTKVMLERLRTIEVAALEAITDYGNKTKRSPDEVLRMVQAAVQQKASGKKQSTGVLRQLHAPTLLLSFLLCLDATCHGAAKHCGFEKAGDEARRGILLGVRTRGESCCPPREWRSYEQQPEQSTDALLSLSLLLARLAETYRETARKANASSNRMGKLRAYGNAIVAPQAAEFVKAAMEYRP